MLSWDWLNILRIVICIVILGYSCVTDWKVRRAPNKLWYIMGGIGLVLGVYELMITNDQLWFISHWALGFIFVFGLMYFIYYFFAYFGMTGIGGADAKALIAISLMFPYYPVFYNGFVQILPLMDVSRSVIFGFSVFGNALVLNMVVPIAIFINNLVNVPLAELKANPVGSFTGYRASIEGLKGKHVRLMSKYSEENGVVKDKRSLGGSEIDDDTYDKLLKWRSVGKLGDKVWVTPKIPFLIPITLGFIVAILYGDILTQAISFILFR